MLFADRFDLHKCSEVCGGDLSTFHEQQIRVRVVRGDLIDNALLREAIRGSEAVLSALGPASLLHPKDLLITRATEAITSVMKQENVNRLIAISSAPPPTRATVSMGRSGFRRC